MSKKHTNRKVWLKQYRFSIRIESNAIRQAALDESVIPFYPNLSWLHYERLMRVKDDAARLWYLKETAREQWDYRTLQRNISSQYYYRLLQTPEQLRHEVSDEMHSLTANKKDKIGKKLNQFYQQEKQKEENF